MAIKISKSGKRIIDHSGRKTFVKLGEKKIKAKGESGIYSWRWAIYRRGNKTTKTQTVKVSTKKFKKKKWSKRSKKKDAKVFVKTVEMSDGTKTFIVKFTLLDRGPRYVTKDRNPRYRLKWSGYRSGAKWIEKISDANKHISKFVKKQRSVKIKQPEYILIKPSEALARAKSKSGFKSLSAALKAMKSDMNDKTAFIKEANKTIARYKRESRKPDSSLKKYTGLPKEFARSKKTAHKESGLLVKVNSFSKRGDKKPRALKELLAVKQVIWKIKMPNGKWRTQSVAFQLTRWGYGRSTRPQFLPSYTVTDYDGKDVAFASRQGDKGEDKLVTESFEKIIYTTSPRKRAKAELNKQVAAFVKMLSRSIKADHNPERNVNRGEATERFQNYRVKVLKYGLKRGYPAIGETLLGDRLYKLIGGAIVLPYKKGNRSPSNEFEWQIIKPKKLEDRKREGSVILIEKSGKRLGSFRSVDSARTKLRKIVNNKVFSYNR